MKYVRTFVTEDGGSAMEEVEVETTAVDFVPGKPALGVSTTRAADNAKFLRVAGDWYGEWHPTPVRQYLAVLSGGFEIETTDGQTELLPIRWTGLAVI